MILENIKLLLSMINIIIISFLIYKGKYTFAWVLAILQALLLLINTI